MLTECRGNGFLALFGAPLAHEDHALRAVRTALDLVQCLHEPPTFLALPLHIRPGVRLGLHTGWVVVGPRGEEHQTPYVAVSRVTQLAEHLQQCATPGVILVSEATARLVQGEVHLEPWEPGQAVPQADVACAYRVCAVRPRPWSWTAVGRHASRRFVGRTRELTLLHERLQHVENSAGQWLA
jgi:class 3 adenylate cyclase